MRACACACTPLYMHLHMRILAHQYVLSYVASPDKVNKPLDLLSTSTLHQH